MYRYSAHYISGMVSFIGEMVQGETKWAASWQNQQNECAQSDQSSLCAWRNLESLATHWVHSEDWSDWADAQVDLSLLGTQSLCWFCHVAAQIIFVRMDLYTCKMRKY